VSPEAIRENERYFAEEVLPARVDRLGERSPGEWQGLFERMIASWADLFIQLIFLRASVADLCLFEGRV